MAPHTPTTIEMPVLSRRAFLRGTATASVVISTGTLTACAGKPVYDGRTNPRGYRFLTQKDEAFLRVAVPVMLAGSFPTDEQAKAQQTERMLGQLDAAIYGLGSPNRDGFRTLFDALGFAPTRYYVTGVWGGWNGVSEARMQRVLERWRESGNAVLNGAYNGLVKTTTLIWYGLPDNWQRSGYPGPQPEVVAALPQFQETA